MKLLILPLILLTGACATLPAIPRANLATATGQTAAYLQRIDAMDDSGPMLNAVIAVNPDALRQAREAEGKEELPDARECCGFGGTFAVKNEDTSVAMLSDKMRSVPGTRAEICTALDSSCLMHIGGGLHRLRSGVRTVHLAEILASTERDFIHGERG